MNNSFSASTEYFLKEGKPNLRACLGIAFEAALSRDIATIVIFTGIGEGPRIAIEEFLSDPAYSKIKIIAVTFPYGQVFKGEDGPVEIEIDNGTRELLREHNIPLVRAHLPFNPISAHYKGHGILGQDLTLMGNALSIFGGSMSLCVQAALMACDAGFLVLGEHVISMTSDTAIIVRTAPTERLLMEFIVREILCKPSTSPSLKVNVHTLRNHQFWHSNRNQRLNSCLLNNSTKLLLSPVTALNGAYRHSALTSQAS